MPFLTLVSLVFHCQNIKPALLYFLLFFPTFLFNINGRRFKNQNLKYKTLNMELGI